MSTPDLSLVMAMAGYDVGFLPPALSSLAPGRLFVELTPAGGGVPRIWVGTVSGSGVAVTASDIVFDPVDNPSTSSAVHVTGTVTPGTEIELCAFQGGNVDHLVQLTPWSPRDASGGTFDVTWWLPVGDGCQVRARMRDDPTMFTDSNLFQVVPDPEP